MSEHVDGGEAILEAFRNLDIDLVISSPGSEWPAFWEALARQSRDGLAGPIYMDCGHETIAVTMASAYSRIKNRVVAVVLHAGAGILQGSMAIHSAKAMEAPLLILSGESMAYGESSFDPGSQWYRNLSIVGGPQRILDPVVKWSLQSPSPETLYESVIRSAEVAQRSPKGPTYLCVSMETLMAKWNKPEHLRKIPVAPQVRPIDDDIDRIAKKLAGAKCPVIVVENLAPNTIACDALVRFAEMLSIPIIEGPGAFYGNFPKSNPLYQGSSMDSIFNQVDLILLIESKSPWYPPSNRPKQAEIICISENPLKTSMVYQTMFANEYLEGNVGVTLNLLMNSLLKIGVDKNLVKTNKDTYTKSHNAMVDLLNAKKKSSLTKDVITVPLLIQTLQEHLPKNTAYVDETIMHTNAIRDHLHWDNDKTYFRAPSGLGQGMGYALGVKMALPEHPVVFLVGDGTFLYNPIIPGLAFAHEHQLPVLIVIFNNARYSAMKHFHDKFYPDSIAAKTNNYFGVNIKEIDYEKSAEMVGGFHIRVSEPKELNSAMKAAAKALASKKMVLMNIIIPD